MRRATSLGWTWALAILVAIGGLPMASARACEAALCKLPCPMHERPKEERACCHGSDSPAQFDAVCKCPTPTPQEEAPAIADAGAKVPILVLALPHCPRVVSADAPVAARPVRETRNHGPPIAGFGRPDSSRAPPVSV